MDFSLYPGSAGYFGFEKSYKPKPKTTAKSIRGERNVLRGRQLTDDEDDDGKYPSGIQLYLQPPIMDITLEMFEDLVVQRLKV
jgi:hypothetical protein